ncbi:MAG: D-glycerate dehydrogenase [Firmicutes bacterium]|nr:D-glycerate dehydrogenase [Bacillota bacterium]HOB34204.1 D-glycerate dehydrogenase [Bacillota bacterium]HPZ90198.1 D-glycerate dehydrogenase [Bacillota bacterium]HQE01588.1 D-glycerate dehydrogenase [Bacillota bacterium]
MAKVYVTRQLPPGGLAKLEKEHQVDVNPRQRPLTREELLETVRHYDAVICLLSDTIDARVIEAARGRVQIFANYAVGYDNIDVAAAQAAGIYVSNTPGVLTEATADLAWALMLAAARHIVAAHNFTVAGKFKGWHPTEFLGRDFCGATLGIVGAGRIGQATARRALGFGMNILYYNRSPKPQFEAECGAKRVELEELLRQSDFVSLHLPLTPQTRGLLNKERLKLLKPSAIIVNTARGAVLDEAYLAHMLKTGRIAGAGLDVYAEEPKIHPDLIGLDNVVLLPHIGSASWQTRLKMAEMAADNVLAVLAGKEPLNPVRP